MTTGEIISIIISILSVAIVIYQSIVLRRTIGNQIYESFIDNSVEENIDVYKKYIPANRRDGWLQFVHDMESSSAYIFYMEKYSTWYVKRNGKQQNNAQTKQN